MAAFDGYSGATGDATRPFDNDGYSGFDPRLHSQRFESGRFESGRFDESRRFDGYNVPEHYSEDRFAALDESKEVEDDYKVSNGFDTVGRTAPSFEIPSYEQSFYTEHTESPEGDAAYGYSLETGHGQGHVSGGAFSPVSEIDGKPLGTGRATGVFDFAQHSHSANGGAVLPSPEEMIPEEGFLLREWKRQNAIHLEEKEKKERERLSQIIDEADDHKLSFYEKRKANCEANVKINRDKEKVFLSNQEHFHKSAGKHYWKAIAELIPHELPRLDVKRGGKDKDKRKPSVIVNQGPKPGKPTDLSRMRQILLKLKHDPPLHMKTPPAPVPGAAPAATPTTAPGTNREHASVENSNSKLAVSQTLAPQVIAAA